MSTAGACAVSVRVQCWSEYSTCVPCPLANSRWPCPAPRGEGTVPWSFKKRNDLCKLDDFPAPCHAVFGGGDYIIILLLLLYYYIIILFHIILLHNLCAVLGSHTHRENTHEHANFLSSLPAIWLYVIVHDAKRVILL